MLWMSPITLHIPLSKYYYKSGQLLLLGPAVKCPIFSSLRNQYHKLVLAAKRAYYSFMVKSSSDCPRRQWNTINNILHRKSIICFSVCSCQSVCNILQRENLTTPPDIVHQPSSGSSLSSTSDTTSRLQHFSCNWRWNTQTDSWSSQQTVWSGCPPNITSQALLLCPCPHHHSHSQPESCCWWVSPQLKQSIIIHHSPSQLIKKPSLDKENLANYRPISNLSTRHKSPISPPGTKFVLIFQERYDIKFCTICR